MVHNSPWPIAVAWALFAVVIELVALLHEYQRPSYAFAFNAAFLCILIMRWCSDVHIEASYEGRHTKIIQKLLKNGFFLFILSEVMFFVGLFGSYLYIMTHPNIWIGCEWPPTDLFEINPMKLPLANAFLLVASGMWGELANDAVNLGLSSYATHYLRLLILLGAAFLAVQFHEYSSAPFGIDDSIYGSLFYFITGFHGIHVCAGLLFIIVQYYRITIGAVTRQHHVGLDLAIWYWHFVDIIWIIVWTLIYYYPTVL
jgi:heme/copper-type cytochrome/quinol oxidase subunit 3